KSFVVNTHHLPAAFESLFADSLSRERPIRLVHEPVLPETGGGVKKAQTMLGTKPFIAYSGDVLTDLPLEPLLEAHFRSGNDVTLALRETGLASNVAFRDGDGRVIDIGNRYGHPGDFDYANVSVWSPQIFERIPSAKKVSFIPVLAEWIGAGGRIGGVVSQEGRWWNLGSRAEYLAVHRTLSEENWRPDYVQPSAWPIRIASDASV